MKQKEQYSFSSTIGVLADYNIKNELTLETGLALSNTVIEIDSHTSMPGPITGETVMQQMRP